MANCKDIILKLETTYHIYDPKRICIAAIGSHIILGNWNENRPLLAINTTGDQWEIYISANPGIRIQWQWVIYDMKKRKVLLWEDQGNNRMLVVPSRDSHIIVPWNDAESRPFPIRKAPACDPYVSFLLRTSASGEIESPVVSEKKKDTVFPGNILFENNGFKSFLRFFNYKA